MVCNLCGRQTPRTRLCKQCSLDKHHEGIPDPWDNDKNDAELLAFECAECSHEFCLDAQARRECPECDYYGLIGHGVVDAEEARA